jgi:serine protease
MFQKLNIMGRGVGVLLFVASFMGGGSLFAQRPEVAADRYFVGFRGPVGAGDRALLASQGAAIGGSFPEVNALEIVVRNRAQLNAIQRNPNVEYVEEVPMRYPVAIGDSELTPSLSNGLYGLITTKANLAHARGITGLGVKVGVADTGLDYTHPDIAGRYKGGIDTVGAGDNDPWWNNDPEETHGTHVAGTILASNNGTGVRGVAYDADLYHARVLGPAGGTTSDIMEGVRWLVEVAGCKVVNLSLGGGFRSRTEENFYKEMRGKGVLIVAATGNDSAKKISFPAAYATNIAVGAVGVNNAIAGFSNTGREIDVVGPGVMVVSSVPLNSGSEASVTAGAEYRAFGMEFAGHTAGLTRTLVNCGLGTSCPASVAGNIALIQRGTNSFAEKVTAAQNAGAAAAIIYNNVAGDFIGTLGAEGSWIPAVSVSNATGAALVAKVGTAVTVVNNVSDWDHFDGTSMATPHVTGVIALIWSARPSLSNTTVENYLFATAGDLGASGFDNVYGRGIVNADAAVALTGH